MSNTKVKVSEITFRRLQKLALTNFNPHPTNEQGLVEIELSSNLVSRLDKVPGSTTEEKITFLLNNIN